MYLCMCTPDLYFTSTEVLIRLQNKSTKIHRAKEQLLFSSTNTSSGGLHGWEGHRHWATLTSSEHSSSKGNTGSRLNPQRVLCNSTEHWSSLALPSCSSHLLLRCFPPGILKHYLPLAVLSNKWCSQKKTWWLQCSSLLQLSPGKAFQDLLAKGGPGWGDRQVRAGSWDTWWSHSVLTSFLWLCLQFTAKTTPVPRIPHMKVTQAPLVLINRHLLKICCSSNPFLITHRSFSKEIQKQNP